MAELEHFYYVIISGYGVYLFVYCVFCFGRTHENVG